MPDRTFAGRTVVVTGAGTGIGRATALAFAAQGATTVIVCGRRKERLDQVAAEHPAVVPVTADVTSEAGAEALAVEVRARGGALDVLVHSAGVFRFTPLAGLGPDTVREVLDTNLLGPLLVTGHLLPYLLPQRGSIVLVSSRAGHNPGPGSSVYAATKAGVHSLTRSWAAELASHGIRVNAVAPGFVRTEAYEANGMTPQQVAGLFDAITPDIPLGRVADVDDITPWITRLADPAASLVTGQIITVDGGMDTGSDQAGHDR
ncbi:SDR family oxidoreductase [Streptomyces sp. NBC_00654]|uniref:SDR family NAD(P)-dependent oxidoreductase n=1 Tax=Streptomyces sp. NBC_00654 TaxID=2975799 RepID=UPI00225B7566|nr:SDR family oxidoreductase [Streptomyces sp. NBC_00654]MCX4970534.1 SDR family oxidoreductase [Streptomyces sp. NBC_00654]